MDGLLRVLKSPSIMMGLMTKRKTGVQGTESLGNEEMWPGEYTTATRRRNGG